MEAHDDILLVGDKSGSQYLDILTSVLGECQGLRENGKSSISKHDSAFSNEKALG
ncbi:MAG: hypothetical protein WCH44_14610 [Betaproteobacteria bacterium]